MDDMLSYKYKLIVDKASDAIISIDDRGYITDFNKSAEIMFWLFQSRRRRKS